MEELRGKDESIEDFLVEHRLRNPEVAEYRVRPVVAPAAAP